MKKTLLMGLLASSLFAADTTITYTYTDDLVAHWGMDSITADGKLYETKEQYHATAPFGVTASQVAGQHGQALNSSLGSAANNNTLGLAYTTSDISFAAGDDFTVTAWLKLTGTIDNTHIPILGTSDGSAFVPNFYDAKFRVWVQAPGPGDVVISGQDTPADLWIHVAIIKSGSNITIYENGLQVDSDAFNRGVTLNELARLNGDIDELTVYNRALTDVELSGIANKTHNLLPSVVTADTTITEDSTGGNTSLVSLSSNTLSWTQGANLAVALEAANAQSVSFQLYNTQGQVVAQKSATVEAGKWVAHFQNNYEGIHILEVVRDNEKSQHILHLSH